MNTLHDELRRLIVEQGLLGHDGGERSECLLCQFLAKLSAILARHPEAEPVAWVGVDLAKGEDFTDYGPAAPPAQRKE
jgi:hypothetical protein